MAQPTCAVSCINNAIAKSGCQSTDTSCFCKDQSYINNFENCAKTLCSPTDYQLWIQWGVEKCASVDIFISTTLDAPTPTVIAGASSFLSTNGGITSPPASQSSSGNSNSGSSGISTAVIAVISVLGCIVLLLIAGGLCLWRHTINKKKKTLRDIVNPRGDEDRSDAGGATYAKTLLSDESTTRYSAIPGWVNAIEMNDRLSVAHSESNFSGTTYPGGPNP